MGIQIWMQFFGWMSLLNIGIYFLTVLAVTFVRKPIVRLHSRWWGVEEEILPQLYLDYIGQYKLLIAIFNVVPFLVLWLMSA